MFIPTQKYINKQLKVLQYLEMDLLQFWFISQEGIVVWVESGIEVQSSIFVISPIGFLILTPLWFTCEEPKNFDQLKSKLHMC